MTKTRIILSLLLLVGSAWAQGAVPMAWNLRTPGGPIIAWQFALAAGGGVQPQAPEGPEFGNFAFGNGVFSLHVANRGFCVQSCAFNRGTFAVGPTVVTINSECSEVSGQLKGNFVFVDQAGVTHRWNGAPANYSQTVCQAAVGGQTVTWWGGGNLTVLNPTTP